MKKKISVKVNKEMRTKASTSLDAPHPQEIREIRLTPPSQTPIVDWHLHSAFDKILIAQEGEPNGTPRLHYHCIIEYSCSRDTLERWIYKVLDCKKGDYNGNALFFTRAIHDKSYQYVVKGKNIVVNKGFNQTSIDDWIQKSDDYVKINKKQKRKDKTTREKEILYIYESIEKDLKERQIVSSVECIIDRVLSICHSQGYKLLAKSQMEMLVLKLIYPYNNSIVRSYYAKSFSFL